MFKVVPKGAAKFVAGSYNVLLWTLLFLFVFRPYDRGAVYEGIWKLILTVVLVAAVFNCNHSKRVRYIIMVLAIPTLIFSWINLYDFDPTIFICKATSTILFVVICAGSIVYDVLVRARVTLETLRGVICAYFMIAFAFAYVYYLVEYLHPMSMHLSNVVISVYSFAHYLSHMLYFSFITLLTIGYGDITPMRDIAQTAAVIEGMIGQFYIAILVARLVSVYSFLSDKRLLKTLEKDITKTRKSS